LSPRSLTAAGATRPVSRKIGGGAVNGRASSPPGNLPRLR